MLQGMADCKLRQVTALPPETGARPRPWRMYAAVLILVAAVRIVSTLTTFSETADEPMHLSSGLEVLSLHRYELQLQNPPLPRLVIALPPWLAGARYSGADPMPEALTKFHSHGPVTRMLFLARVGILLFFVLAAVGTWLWARRGGDPAAALAALLFFSTQPVILGHSGLATLDVAGTAGFVVALLAFFRWMEQPSLARAAVLALAFGFSVACKFLCLAYVPLACAAIYAVRLLRDPETRRRWRALVTVVVVPPVAALVVWATYGFSTAPASTLRDVQHAFPDTITGRLLAAMPDAPVPAPQFVRGMAQLIDVNRQGFPGYALGHWSLQGWWWYFPLALGLKTTLASLLLLILGGILARRWGLFLESAAAAAAILLLSMMTHVDIGIRYILPVYVMLSIAAGAGFVAMFRDRRSLVRVSAMVLLAWHCIASLAAHPDYMAYFNEAAVRDPSWYLVDSNLDWGQDILRLRDETRRLHIRTLGVSLFGPDNLDLLGFPPHYYVDASTPTQGWIAVSDHSFRSNYPYGGWRWLDPRRCERVGKSIRLCWMP